MVKQQMDGLYLEGIINEIKSSIQQTGSRQS
jgi:hypothetical protein